ncbi:MAG: hypothetical protein H6817_07935 [Phycisphaerales bacterium]|nr:hypothetical protein [Phycisphaerales bacterium]
MSKRLLVGLVATAATMGMAQASFAAIDCNANGTGTDPVNNITIEGGQINMAGASLFVDFFRAAASTNDWIDVDTDGFFGFVNPDPMFLFVDQLATTYQAGNPLNTYWALNYRSVGSVNGFGEFVDSQLCGVVETDQIPSEGGIFNRFEYATGGAIASGFGDFVNSTGTPLEQCSIDAAVLDVPGSWAVVGLGTEADASWNKNPNEVGYGLNSVASSVGDVPQLQSLSRDCTTNSLNFNEEAPDANTLYSLTTAWVPVAIIANRGVGTEDVKYSELQYHFVTGRLPNGENLTGATRDVGSGTRNAAMNSLNIDPSWGRGENLGTFTESSSTDLLGPTHQPSNKGGSSRMEGAVQNNRLAIGYTGLAGGSRAARDASRGFYEVMSVCKDVDAAGNPLCDCDVSGYVRPSIDTTLDNCDACAGYQVAGFESYVVRGNINANRNPGDPKYDANDPPVENQALADYLNNIFDSTDLFTGSVFGGECGDSYVCSGDEGIDCVNDVDCGTSGTCTTIRPCAVNTDCEAGDFCGQIVNSPGQSLAVSFFLPAALDCVSSNGEPMEFNAIAVNTDLQEYTRANNGLGWGGDTAAYGSANPAGLVPGRLAKSGSTPYTDGQLTSYIYWNGAYTSINAGSELAMRNRTQGDFNNDGDRDLDDAVELVKSYYTPRAWQQTGVATGGASGANLGDMTADNAIPEVLGDFDGDGEFSKEDLRYFADGLALVTSPARIGLGKQLDRKQGAIAIDNQINALGKPYPWADSNGLLKVAPGVAFGEPTFIAPASTASYLANTGNVYKPGDFRGDVAGGSPVPGAGPRGWDGKIDAQDIDYVCHNIKDWSNIDEAVFMDLSCDMDGDLDVDADDVTELVGTILGTAAGDANLDGNVDAADQAIVAANQTAACNADNSCGWADGDFDCDGDVDGDDLAYFGVQCAAHDVNCDGSTNAGDIGLVASGANFGQNPPACDRADVDGSGGAINPGDIGVIASGANFGTGTGPCVCQTNTPAACGVTP